MDYNINFPHLHIYLEHVIKSITIHGFSIAMYGIVIAAGMVLGTMLARAEAKRTGQNADLYIDYAVMMLIFSVVCARLYYVAFSWEMYKDHPISILNIRQGGLAIYGGILGAILFSVFFTRWKKIRFGTLADTAVLGLLLGQIMGRWGNFFNREAFGGYTDGLFAMQLPVSAVRSVDITPDLAEHILTIDGISYIQVHPTFLYESLWNLGVLTVLLLMRRHKKFEGQLFCMYMVGYGIGRAWIEGLRTDPLLIPGTQIPVSQALSLALAALGAVIIIVRCTLAGRRNKSFQESQEHDVK